MIFGEVLGLGIKFDFPKKKFFKNFHPFFELLRAIFRPLAATATRPGSLERARQTDLESTRKFCMPMKNFFLRAKNPFFS